MTSALRNIFVSGFFAAALAACGGGGGGGSSTPAETPTPTPPTTTPPSPSDVTLSQLTGTWFGTFDPKGSMQAMEIAIDASANITDIKLEGTSTDLTGTITKASEAPRTFRFVLKNKNTPPDTVSEGMLLADPTGTYLVFLNGYFDFGVVQKGATALPTYAKADVEKTWSGDTLTATLNSDPQPGFATIAQKSSNGPCTSDTPTASKCTITVSGGVSRAVTSLTQDGPRGRWGGNYADTPQSGSPQNGTIKVYLSPDKAFAGVWACQNPDTGFPGTCDFSSWKSQ